MPTISVDACKGYDVIFKGKVDSISTCVKGKSLVWFTLSKLYLGEAFEQQAVEFDCESDCQMSFAKDEEWLIYAKFVSYGDYGLGFCGRSRKHFSDTLNDYHMQTHHMSFSSEEKYLQDQLGVKQIKNEAERNKNTYHNPQPSDSSKIWLLVVSFLGMIVFYYFFASSRFRRKK